MNKIKVAINGYGVIGKRIADAVILQDDMELVGVTARTPDFRLFSAKKKGINIYSLSDLNQLLKKVDVIIDATPAGIGRENKIKYDEIGIKSIFEGGESHDLTGSSFVSEVNYKNVLQKQSTRVVSCNTTAICRITNPFVTNGVLDKAYIALARRGADPIDSHKEGPLGTVVLEDSIPSHQGSDAQTVIPNLNILTVAIAVSTTIGHLHIAFLHLNKELSKDEVIKILKSSSRVVPINYKDGITSENQLTELMRDLGRPRADMWEVAFWEDTLNVEGKDASFYYQVHNEAVVIPENIDAIRAISGIVTDPIISIEKTNKSLGIISDFR